ncbi:hypothetical protein A2962_01440 [Candidatus Woesebacteria bacterium RIFCSPLOWO2_01_FULL_39_61]|nr:MAG: hypothetical protein A2692_01680 [Candidatus Woesebacteria bacterium RIFCSPHIGHO2_01_FULL_39_95]OGM38780.1 MAG: hypothetical protein A3E13_01025 [Candidatus Woesebacteria bacterium RIFCSPHIGHO2_12_FULL_40_20]OGM65786.1 MAG: hypothetical protein A2962_01440 [Candidatus Woesebacteria bacterium RIFCSPLOWO2_01_FULL_39_61]OGM73859.1 MAG: hypothetical protein A3H19_04285 [Candidatus Woesebacteria bacterium RIFCSPLOWO2_12_FULL_39_9]
MGSSQSITWLSLELQEEIRKHFQPKYKQPLTDERVIRIADNLTSVMEVLLKMRWRQKYGNLSRP